MRTITLILVYFHAGHSSLAPASVEASLCAGLSSLTQASAESFFCAGLSSPALASAEALEAAVFLGLLKCSIPVVSFTCLWSCGNR